MPRNDVMHYLLRLSRAMNSKLELEPVLSLVIEASVQLTGGSIGVIALREADNNFRVRAYYGIPRAALPMLLPLLQDIPSDSGDPAAWSVPHLPHRLALINSALGIPLGQIIALPLSVDGNLLGVIYVLRSGLPFSLTERETLSLFADQAAVSVRNATLYGELFAQRARLSVIMNYSADGIVILSPEMRIIDINAGLEHLTGVPREMAIGMRCADVLKLKGQESGDSGLQSCPVSAKDLQGATYIEGKLSNVTNKIEVGITYVPVRGEHGELICVVANVRDISRYREAERLKSSFISGISHELKTPVAIIRGYAETMAREDVTWDANVVRESANIIVDETARLSRQIENLLEASRLEAGGLPLHFTSVNIPELAAEAARNTQIQSQSRRIEVMFPADFPLCSADEDRIREVLLNLLENAMKYSPTGTPVEIGGFTQGDWAITFVSDQGPGVPAQYRSFIFDRFTRLDASGKTPGAGLGLYLAKSIIEAHGGRIWVDDAPGGGARFLFSLPVWKGDQK